MLKKIFTGLLSIYLVFLFCATCVIAEPKQEDAFTVLKIPYGTDGYSMHVRYTDTKEPISLATYYDGYLHATVPSYNANRSIEAFKAEPVDFTDYDTSNYEFFLMRELSQTGVIRGNEKGEALPFANVTRAEAVAMLMRWLGLENMPEADANKHYEDVSLNDWFYSVVMSATACGIVEGTSDTLFLPGRNVTREELTTMTARAMEYAGLQKSRADISYYVDLDAVSEWAKDAYVAVGANNISDTAWVEVGEGREDEPVRSLSPQKAATRYDVAYILFNTTRSCQMYPSQAAEEYGFDQSMPVIDGSTSTYPFTEAVYGALFSNGQNHPEKPAKHSKSHVSYERLINGEVDMMFASVYPASDILELAKEKGVELELIPIAYDAMIFFTNIDNPIEGLTKTQISDIYVKNAYQNWLDVGGVDAKLVPYCRNNDSGSHAQMERHFLDGNEIHETIQRETTSTTMSNVLTDVMHAKQDEPLSYGLGYSIYYYFHNMDPFYDTKSQLKLLAVDGVHPNDETIANGSYPLSNNTYVVLRADTPEDAPARKMAEFMLTEKGQECVKAAGFGTLK